MSDDENSARVATTLSELDAAALALSSALKADDIPHAFCGGYWAAKLGGTDRFTEDVDCIVGAGFKQCINALKKAGQFEVPSGMASGAKRVYFIIPVGLSEASQAKDSPRVKPVKIKIELLRAGEFGPVHLTDDNTIEIPPGIPALTPTEFVRAKVKAWTARRAVRDVNDVLWVMHKYGEVLDVDRVNPQGGLDEMASEVGGIKEKWKELKALADEEDEED